MTPILKILLFRLISYNFASERFEVRQISSRVRVTIFLSVGSPSAGRMRRRTMVPFSPRIRRTAFRSFIPTMSTNSLSPCATARILSFGFNSLDRSAGPPAMSSLMVQ